MGCKKKVATVVQQNPEPEFNKAEIDEIVHLMNKYGVGIVGGGISEIKIEGTEKRFHKLDDIQQAKFAVYPRTSRKAEADRTADPTTQSEGISVLDPTAAAEQQGYKVESYEKELNLYRRVYKVIEKYAADLAKGGDEKALYDRYLAPIAELVKSGRREQKISMKKLIQEIHSNPRKFEKRR